MKKFLTPKQKILLIDNYDSFTYNLYQQIGKLGGQVQVLKNDRTTISKIKKINPHKIIISPGPKTPKESGISNKVILEFYKKKPILGVCLGHECLGDLFGSKIIRARNIMHGKVSEIQHQGTSIFKDIPTNFQAARYHSLILDQVPSEFHLLAETKEKEIMAMEHKKYPIYGVQFHPESFMTDYGDKLMLNFLKT